MNKGQSPSNHFSPLSMKHQLENYFVTSDLRPETFLLKITITGLVCFLLRDQTMNLITKGSKPKVQITPPFEFVIENVQQKYVNYKCKHIFSFQARMIASAFVLDHRLKSCFGYIKSQRCRVLHDIPHLRIQVAVLSPTSKVFFAYFEFKQSIVQLHFKLFPDMACIQMTALVPTPTHLL